MQQATIVRQGAVGADQRLSRNSLLVDFDVEHLCHCGLGLGVYVWMKQSYAVVRHDDVAKRR